MARNINHATQQRQRHARRAARRAKDNAAREGFKNLNAGDILCPDRSTSQTANELEIDLAARQIEHCLEAWNFLSQSTWSLLNSQDKQATHMAYYAEIRAANSLLSASGIAEKSNSSYLLKTDNTRETFEARTHSFIKDIWPYWCKRNDAIQAYESLYIAQSLTLGDIATALSLSRLSHGQTINRWGFELTRFYNDSNARNKASYDTTLAYNGIPKLANKDYCKVVALAWEHLQPGGIAGQMQLEVIYAQYFVHSYLLDKATQGGSIDPIIYNSEINKFIQRLSSNTGIDQNFLSKMFDLSHDSSDERFMIFDHANERRTNPENVYCRALILTRLATNKLKRNLDQPNTSHAISWIGEWLKEMGIIDENESPSDVITYIDQYIDAAADIKNMSLRSVWATEENARKAAIACKINSSLCWGLSGQT